MEIRQLRYFLSLAELGSVKAAAERHYVTQPAVSIQIKKLEGELGEKLFFRRGRIMVPTSFALKLITPATDVINRFDSLCDIARRLGEGKEGNLRLGTIDAASIYVLPPVFRAFRRLYPGVDVSVEVSDSTRLVEDLGKGKIELAIVVLPVGEGRWGRVGARKGGERNRAGTSSTAGISPEPGRRRDNAMAGGSGADGGYSLAGGVDMEAIPVFKEEMVLVVHPRHFPGGSNSLERIAERGLITYPASSVTRRIIERAFVEAGLPFRAAMEVSSPEAIKRLTEAGLGASVLPLPVVMADIKRGTLRTIPTGKVAFTRLFGLVYPRNAVLSPAARAFVEMVKKKGRKG